MNRLPSFPLIYDPYWGNTFVRTLETNLSELARPISSGWSSDPIHQKRNLDPTSAVGKVGNVSVSTAGTTNVRVNVSGVGGLYNGTVEETDAVLETLISDMKIRGYLA